MPFSLSKSVCPSPLLKNFVLIVPPFSIYGQGLRQPQMFIKYWDSDIKKTWSPELSLASHLEARRKCPVSRSEQRRSPTLRGITNHYTDSSIGVRIHQWLSSDSGHVYSTPTGHLLLLCFWLTFWNFPTIPRCQNQSVVNAFHYVCSTKEHAKLKNS